ncbi:MAG: S8 family serine peptidase [Sphingobacteriaceae bacterium]|nr:S8 family serine peptidase [Sphingobacteriaceae bacterium]
MKWIKIMLLLFVFKTNVYAQSKNEPLPANWYNLDYQKDGFLGISTEKAYTELLKNKPLKQKVVVAVIDGGTDIHHEDLKSVLWVNEKEIPDNGIDDDKNGYVDDVHGWNFLGSKNGNLAYENLEIVRQLKILKPKYKATLNTTVLDSAKNEEFKIYKKMTAVYGKKYQEAYETYGFLMVMNTIFEASKDKDSNLPTLEKINDYKTEDEMELYLKTVIKKGAKEEGSFEKFYKSIQKALKDYNVMLKYNLNFNYDERSTLVGDSVLNSGQRFYGNKDVAGSNPDHGTHVAGIIGANRNNTIGINGVANYVSIMSIRVVPEGDERDKDVANGIRYAVDNGAKVINMSFGKAFVSDKKVVDDAVKYAAQKGVLLVHAAGNDNENNDVTDNFPNKYYESEESKAYKKTHPEAAASEFIAPAKNTKEIAKESDKTKIKPLAIDSLKFNLPHADNWIEVGASTYKDGKGLKADFSNYGKYSVDVFAPGYRINSTIPDSKYEEFDGTSMASPVVAGLSALILAYYPHFTPAEVRDIIIKSVYKVKQKVAYTNEKGENLNVLLSELCVSGGVVNAYNALKLAETYKSIK